MFVYLDCVQTAVVTDKAICTCMYRYILRCRLLHDLHDRGRQAEAHVNHVATDTEVM